IGLPTRGTYFTDLARSLERLQEMANAHELQDTQGRYAEFVQASLSTTHRVANGVRAAAGWHRHSSRRTLAPCSISTELTDGSSPIAFDSRIGSTNCEWIGPICRLGVRN